MSIVPTLSNFLAIVLACIATLYASIATADETPVKEPSKEVVQYSPEVVSKAESILEAENLRRSGKTIQSTASSEISRDMTLLSRTQRELRLLQQSLQAAEARFSENRRQLQVLNAQVGELSIQLARVAGVSTQANNRVIGLIEATRAQIVARTTERERLKEQVDAERAKVTAAETAYAETVLAIREDFDKLQKTLSESLQKNEVQIALRVMATNFETPQESSAAAILKSLDKRLEKIEQEIFRETIPLEVSPGGSLRLDVVIGKKPVKMVLDSGASLVFLPAETAAALEIEIPSDAPQLSLVQADGRTIPARAVLIPRMRIGAFEAEDVEAAVVDRVAIEAEPLLGMSFLSHFKFEINANEKTLSLLRVATE